MSENEAREAGGLGEEDLAAILQSIGAVAPLMKGLWGAASPPTDKKSGSGSKREALLLGLRPYLSPTRAAALDYLIRIGRIGDALRTLQ